VTGAPRVDQTLQVTVKQNGGAGGHRRKWVSEWPDPGTALASWGLGMCGRDRGPGDDWWRNNGW